MKMEMVLADNVQGIGKMGQRVTLELSPSDVHDPTEMPTYLAGYRPNGYRADEVSPVILVDNDSDKYRTFDSDDAFRRVDVKGSVNGAVPEVDPKSTLATYKVVERVIGSFIPRQTELQRGNNYQPRMQAMRRCRRAIELDREIDVWTLLETSGNWTAGNVLTLGAGQEWDVGASSDPIKDIQDAMEASAQEVTGIWVNQKIGNILLRHVSVRDHMRQMLGDTAAPAALGMVANARTRNVDFQIPGLPPIHISAAKVLNETTNALEYILDDVVILVTSPPGVPDDGEEIASSYTFRRRGPSGTGFEVREFEVAGRGSLGGTMVVASMADIAVHTGPDVGGIVLGVV